MKTFSSSVEPRGVQFIGFDSFSAFEKSKGERPGEIVLTSPELSSHIRWDELIASWNAEMPTHAYLKIEARAANPSHTTKWYVMGLWSGDPAQHPRESVRGQKDDDGTVNTDTLALKQPSESLQVRLTLGGDGGQKPELKFLSFSLLDSRANPAPRTAQQKSLGQIR